MKNRYHICEGPLSRIFLILVLVAAPAAARAGAWARDLGGIYTRVGAGLFIGQGAFYFAPGAPRGTMYGLAGELYGELGLSRGLEIDLSLRGVDNRHVLDSGEVRRSGGAEDLEGLLKWAPLSGWHALAFLVGLRAALYQRVPMAEIADGTPQIGPGGQDVLFGMAYGRSFRGRPGWFGIDVTARLRISGASAGIRTRAELGGKLLGPLVGALTFEAQPAFGRDQDQPPDGPAPVPLVLGLGGKLLVSIAAGLGLALDFAWYPDPVNDGPGYRVGLGATYEFRGVRRK
jgi:hypothetical protein